MSPNYVVSSTPVLRYESSSRLFPQLFYKNITYLPVWRHTATYTDTMWPARPSTREEATQSLRTSRYIALPLDITMHNLLKLSLQMRHAPHCRYLMIAKKVIISFLTDCLLSTPFQNIVIVFRSNKVEKLVRNNISMLEWEIGIQVQELEEGEDPFINLSVY